MKFWHVTSSDCVEAILRDGLRPGSYLVGEDSTNIRDYYAETVRDEGKVPVILVIEGDSLDPEQFAPDANGIDEPLTFTLGMTEDEVAEAWADTDGTWQDCLEVIGTCRYLGTVPASAVRVEGVAVITPSVPAPKGYVYVLVEGPLVKVGLTNIVWRRAAEVTPNVEWNRSFALEFESRDIARQRELAIQRMLGVHSWQRVQKGRDGGTEFFAIEALPLIETYVQSLLSAPTPMRCIAPEDLQRVLQGARPRPMRPSISTTRADAFPTGAGEDDDFNLNEAAEFSSWVNSMIESKSAVAITSERGGFALLWFDAVQPGQDESVWQTADHMRRFDFRTKGTNQPLSTLSSWSEKNNLFVGRVFFELPLDPDSEAGNGILGKSQRQIAESTFAEGLTRLRSLPVAQSDIEVGQVYEMWLGRNEQAHRPTDR